MKYTYPITNVKRHSVVNPSPEQLYRVAYHHLNNHTVTRDAAHDALQSRCDARLVALDAERRSEIEAAEKRYQQELREIRDRHQTIRDKIATRLQRQQAEIDEQHIDRMTRLREQVDLYDAQRRDHMSKYNFYRLKVTTIEDPDHQFVVLKETQTGGVKRVGEFHTNMMAVWRQFDETTGEMIRDWVTPMVSYREEYPVWLRRSFRGWRTRLGTASHPPSWVKCTADVGGGYVPDADDNFVPQDVPYLDLLEEMIHPDYFYGDDGDEDPLSAF